LEWLLLKLQLSIAPEQFPAAGIELKSAKSPDLLYFRHKPRNLVAV
jgi:hypothetical protein